MKTYDAENGDPTLRFTGSAHAFLAMGGILTSTATLWTKQPQSRSGITLAVLRWETPESIPTVDAIAHVSLEGDDDKIKVSQFERSSYTLTPPGSEPVRRSDWHSTEEGVLNPHLISLCFSREGITLDEVDGTLKTVHSSGIPLDQYDWRSRVSMRPLGSDGRLGLVPGSSVSSVVFAAGRDEVLVLSTSAHHIASGGSNPGIQGFIVLALISKTGGGEVVLKDLAILVPDLATSFDSSLRFAVVNGSQDSNSQLTYNFRDNGSLLTPVTLKAEMYADGIRFQAFPSSFGKE